MREPQRQISPWFQKLDRIDVAIASSRSASAKITFGFFPPSSSELLEPRSRVGGDPCARHSSAGERDHRHVGMGRQRPAGLHPVSMDDVDHARRNACLERQLGQAVCGDRRELARFRDAGVPRRNRRRDLPRQQIQRQVPWRDQAGDADRLPQGVIQRVRVGDMRLAREMQNRRTEETEVRYGVECRAAVPE